MRDIAVVGKMGHQGKKTEIKAAQRKNENKKRSVIPVYVFPEIQKMALHVFPGCLRDGNILLLP
ncbi:hypothetical protein [Komagataeibacter europaeus]|uniref:hypothetical protein n=1 Tax=Komagataeibacter europaeus TaxID=33995 RepID=UPI00217515BD|nr:hypothetical protein [Komagataeibacter europaeus]